jgi:sialate O-acetylesterase
LALRLRIYYSSGTESALSLPSVVMNVSRCFFSRFFLSLVVVSFVFASAAHGEVKLPALISDHMVLQADAEAPIWGWAAAGESVAVSIGSANVKSTAGANGRWQLKLPKLSAGGPHTLEVKGANTLSVKDVLVGEVWLGSGQSNMAMTVNRANDFEKETAAANYPQIRMFTVTSKAAATAQADCEGAWVVCSPDTVARFSATAYFFGREIHQALGVPVGLINSSVGGTPIESWISPEAQAGSPELQPLLKSLQSVEPSPDLDNAKAKYEQDLATWRAAQKKAKAAGQPLPKRPQDPLVVRERRANVGGLFNGKIAPLDSYRIRGALWYQGEANSTPDKAQYYRYQLPLLIHDWRTRWGYEFPFAWVQLPNFGGPGRDWPVVRQAMLDTLKVPNTGMAITIDIGEEKDIHPKDKQDVGKRLALWTLGTVYGKSVPTSGPLPMSHERRGDSIVVTFSYTDGGLVAKDGNLSGFELGDEKAFKPATAKIEGDKVIVMSDGVANPVAVRYAWANNPRASLFNSAGLPATPFQLLDIK